MAFTRATSTWELKDYGAQSSAPLSISRFPFETGISWALSLGPFLIPHQEMFLTIVSGIRK
jgi:hypothetical protein